MILWLSILALVVVWTAVVASVLLSSKTGASVTSSYDVAVYKDQLEELDRDVNRGVIGANEAASARVEISRKLIAAMEKSKSETAGQVSASKKRPVIAAATVGLIVPTISLLLYSLNGSPGVPNQPYTVDPEIWRQRAQLYLETGEFGRAANAFDQAMAVSARTPDLLAGQGIALVFGLRGIVNDDAERVFEELLEFEPDDATGHYFLGLARAQRQDLGEAIDRWRIAVANAPPNWPWSETARQQLATAESLIADGQSSPPAGPTQEDIDAAAEMDDTSRQQMIEGMVEGLAARLADDPNDLEGWLQLARSYVVLGDESAAIQSLTAARDAFAGDRDAIRLIETMEVELGLPK